MAAARLNGGLSLHCRAGARLARCLARCATVLVVSKRTPSAKRPGKNWPTPLFDGTAQSPDSRVDDADDADEASDPRVVMEAVLGGFAQITDPVEAEVLGSTFLGAIGLFGADLAAVAAGELVSVIEAVGDP